MTDGVRLHFFMVTSDYADVKRRKTESSRTTKANLKKSFEEQNADLIEEYADFKTRRQNYTDEDFKIYSTGYLSMIKASKAEVKKAIGNEKKKKNSEKKKNKDKVLIPPPNKTKKVLEQFVIPDGATLVGADFGVRNVLGCAREDNLMNGWTYSSATYRHDTGEKRRKRLEEEALAEAKLNSEFDQASKEDANASTKTSNYAKLLAAMQTKGKHFKILYNFYGNETRSLSKFLNYIGSQRVLHKLVKKIAPKKTETSG